MALTAFLARFQKICLNWFALATSFGPSPSWSPARMTLPLSSPLDAEHGQRLVEEVRDRSTSEKTCFTGGGEVQELVDGLGDPFGLPDDDVHELALLPVEGQVALEDLDRAGDGRQGVADLVGQRRPRCGRPRPAAP